MNPTILATLIAAVVGVVSSLSVAVLTRPKTTAEAKQLNTSASVAISADVREWAQKFIDAASEANDRARVADGHSRDAEEHASAAEEHATAAVQRAGVAETRAQVAEDRARACDERYSELETLAIKAYGHIRKLNEAIRTMGGSPPALPPELEAIWNGEA